MLIKLAYKSLLQRKTAAVLIILAISLSMSALLLTRSLSSELKNSFNSSVSGTDLIVGARSHPLQVLLYSVFRLGTPTQAISAERLKEIEEIPQRQWSFPIALGDSLSGYSVIGTTDDYFRYFKYGRKQSLLTTEGEVPHFAQVNDTIIGATVAREGGYKIGDELYLSHGVNAHSFHVHKNVPFRITAILQPTGTPVDRSVHVHIGLLQAIHNETWLHEHHLAHHHDEHEHEEHEHADEHDYDEHDHHEHADDHDHDEHEHHEHADEHDHDEHEHADEHEHHEHADEHDHDENEHADEHEHHEHADEHDHDGHEEHGNIADVHFDDLPAISKVSAVFVGLKSKALTFQAREILNQPDEEPLTAVIPGLTLSEFWQLLANAENLLQVLSGLMLITGLLGSVAMLQVSVAFRREEISLLRLIGAHPLSVFTLLELEVLLLTVSGWVLALLFSGLAQTLAAPWLAEHFSLVVNPTWWPPYTHWMILASLLLSMIAGFIPAISAYRLSSDIVKK